MDRKTKCQGCGILWLKCDVKNVRYTKGVNRGFEWFHSKPTHQVSLKPCPNKSPNGARATLPLSLGRKSTSQKGALKVELPGRCSFEALFILLMLQKSTISPVTSWDWSLKSHDLRGLNMPGGWRGGTTTAPQDLGPPLQCFELGHHWSGPTAFIIRHNVVDKNLL